jgi:hypothetical protein
MRDDDSGVTYEPHRGDNGELGFKATRDDGAIEYIVLNPSGGSDDGVATVFVYINDTGDPLDGGAVHHYVMFDGPQYVATINVPGYLPMDDDPPTFSTAQAAWSYLAGERENAEDDAAADDEEPGDYSSTRERLAVLGTEAHWSHADVASWLDDLGIAPDGTGTVYGDTPGAGSEHDLGLAYSVSLAELDDS